MRNFANYDVDIHGKSSGVLKTICKKCLPTRKNKRDRSLRVNVDTGHCHCYHCGADFYVPDDVEERKNAERAVARKRRAGSHSAAFSASDVRCFENHAFRRHGALAGGDALHPAVRHSCPTHHRTGRIYAAIRQKGTLHLLQLF